MPTVVAFETLTQLFLNLVRKYKGADKTAFARKPAPDRPYESITWDEVSEDTKIMAAYLVEHGVEPGDRVAILSENRYEWAVVDLALQLIGGVNVSIYTTLPAGQVEYILQDSEAKFFFVSTGIQLKKAIQVFDRCEHLQHIIAFDKPRVESYMEQPYVSLYEQAVEEGLKRYPRHEEEIEDRAQRIKPEDLVTLIYTSGTTGKPKGAMLTHRNIVSNVKAAHRHIDITDSDRALSFLPLCHSFERTAGYYAMIAGGAEIFYAESVDTVARNLVEARPTIVMSVPRLFEKIYNIVTQNVEKGSAVKKAIFNWAVKVGRKYANGKRGLVTVEKTIADKLVFNKLKERTGGNIRFFVSGGAALPPEIGRFFKAAGILILQGYGLTETSPVLAANKPGDEEMDSVGQILHGVTVGIQRLEDAEIICQVSGEDYPTDVDSEQGEIICQGPNVMEGYWKNVEATREMIDEDGWLHTGDIGRFVDGKLQITDRIKHMIVNAGGKNIYPGPIEDMFKTSKWIDQLVVVGERQPYMAALIVPDFEVLEPHARQLDIEFSSKEDLVQNEDIRSIYKKEVSKYSRELASHEKIRDFRLVPGEFSVESGELTPTLKVKRRIVEDKYGHLIDDMFENALV